MSLDGFGMTILEWENFLNSWTGKRYHINLDEYRGYELIEIIQGGGKCCITNKLTEHEMTVYLLQHVKVELKI